MSLRYATKYISKLKYVTDALGKSTRAIATSTLKTQLYKRARTARRRIRSPATRRTQGQKLLRQANRKLAVAAACQDTAAHRAGGNNQASVSTDLFIFVEEEERVSILSVSRRDRLAKSHVDELIEPIEHEDIAASGGVSEAEFRYLGIPWCADFAGIDFARGCGVVVQSEAARCWARKRSGYCGKDCGGTDLGGDVRYLEAKLRTYRSV